VSGGKLDALVDAVEDRLGLISSWEGFRDRLVHGGVRLRHVFPALITYLFVQQAVLGVVLATYYSPSATDAWASTAYIQDQVSMGWFVRGLHYHGTSVFIIVLGLWLGQMVLHRAYKAPREVTWWAAIGMLGIGLALGLTGNPLPWDQAGYWGILVELSITEQAPGGGMIRTLIQGGSDAGNLSILRLYALHVFVLPAVFGLLLWLVSRQRAQHGLPAPDGMSDAEAHKTTQRYFPAQAFLDVLAMAAVAGIIVALTMHDHGAELLGPADPTENFQARPEWYFLFLYKLRMFFEGPLEPVATMVIPGAAVTFLVVAPFVDKIGGKFGRALVLGGMAVLMTGTVGLTIYGVQSDAADEEFQKSLAATEKSATEARAYAKAGVVPLGGPAVFFNDPEYQTKMLYKEHCQGCHSLDGQGGDEGPSLEDYSSRAWVSDLVRNANDDRFFGHTKMKDEMDPYPEEDLPAEQFEPLIEYLMQLQGDPGVVIDEALAKKGAELWEDELECNSCHEVEAGEEADGPNLHGHGSQAWVARVIRDSSAGDLFGDYAAMPKFADKLSDEEIHALAAFVVKQRGLEPAELTDAAAAPEAEGDDAAGDDAAADDETPEAEAAPAEAEGEAAVPADGEAPAEGEPPVEGADAVAEGEAAAAEGEPAPEAADADAAGEPADAAPEPAAKPKPKRKPKPKPAKPKADRQNGRVVYGKKCKSCHGGTGKGDTKFGKKNNISPLSGGSRASIKKAIVNGVPGTKMKSYAKKLTAQEIDDVTAFVKSL